MYLVLAAKEGLFGERMVVDEAGFAELQFLQHGFILNQKKYCAKAKVYFFETQKESKETKVRKMPAFGEVIISQDTAEWTFIRFSFCGFAQNLTWTSIAR
jgi:hypothetical protein